MTRRTADTVTDRVILRDVVDADLPTLFAHQLDPEANRMAAFPPFRAPGASPVFGRR